MNPTTTTATAPVALASMPVDPRIAPLVAALTDDEAARVLLLMNAEWCSDDEDGTDLIGTPAANRALIAETIVMNMATASSPHVASTPEAEFAALETFIARARAHG